MDIRIEPTKNENSLVPDMDVVNYLYSLIKEIIPEGYSLDTPYMDALSPYAYYFVINRGDNVKIPLSFPYKCSMQEFQILVDKTIPAAIEALRTYIPSPKMYCVKCNHVLYEEEDDASTD
jgi:hypothetical protein